MSTKWVTIGSVIENPHINMSRTTIRDLEKYGVVVPRRNSNGRREYSEEHIEILVACSVARETKGWTIEFFFDRWKQDEELEQAINIISYKPNSLSDYELYTKISDLKCILQQQQIPINEINNEKKSIENKLNSAHSIRNKTKKILALYEKESDNRQDKGKTSYVTVYISEIVDDRLSHKINQEIKYLYIEINILLYISSHLFQIN